MVKKGGLIVLCMETNKSVQSKAIIVLYNDDRLFFKARVDTEE